MIVDEAWQAHVIEVNGLPSMRPSADANDSAYNGLKARLVQVGMPVR